MPEAATSRILSVSEGSDLEVFAYSHLDALFYLRWKVPGRASISCTMAERVIDAGDPDEIVGELRKHGAGIALEDADLIGGTVLSACRRFRERASSDDQLRPVD